MLTFDWPVVPWLMVVFVADSLFVDVDDNLLYIGPCARLQFRKDKSIPEVNLEGALPREVVGLILVYC